MSQSVRSLVSPRVLVALLAGISTMLLVVLFAAPPAFAHDRLLEADPADGATVHAVDFTAVTLTFSAEPLELGNQMVVKDSAGTVLFEGEPRIEGMKAIAELKGVPTAGEATVQWRVVSSDGHPITGQFAYTVRGDAASDGGTQEAGPASDAGGEAIVPLETPSAQVAQNETTEQKNSQGWLWWLPVLALGVLATVAGGYLYRDDQRRRR